MNERFGWLLKFFKKDARAKTETTANAEAPQDKASPILPTATESKDEKS